MNVIKQFVAMSTLAIATLVADSALLFLLIKAFGLQIR